MDILSNEDLKNRLLYSLRNGKFPKNVVGRAEKLGRKLRSFALPMLMAASSTSVADMSASSGGWHAVSSSANNLTTSVGSDGAEKKIASKAKETSFDEMRNFEVVDDFSGLKNRDNLKIDASGVMIRLSDMERAAGEESEQMKKAWDISLNINVGSRRCTKAMKKLLRQLGMVTSEAMENGFDGVVPAWGLIPFFDRGDIFLECDRKVCSAEDNLAYKAAAMFRNKYFNKTGKTFGVHIIINKIVLNYCNFCQLIT